MLHRQCPKRCQFTAGVPNGDGLIWVLAKSPWLELLLRWHLTEMEGKNPSTFGCLIAIAPSVDHNRVGCLKSFAGSGTAGPGETPAPSTARPRSATISDAPLVGGPGGAVLLLLVLIPVAVGVVAAAAAAS
ncbi:unnamed protein product [Linum trigynum]|uniref:Uncharacterized protein n=2 Tax=Linum trigynum TaxID=586398 RepID=A0AAV2GTV0_9ROSI